MNEDDMKLVTPPEDDEPDRFCSYCRTMLFKDDDGSDLCVLCIERKKHRPQPLLGMWPDPEHEAGTSHGGTLAEVPEPHVWRHATGRGHYGRRTVRASVMKYGLNPHFYVRIEEEDDAVWDSRRAYWASPYRTKEGDDAPTWWKGRSIDNPNYDGFVRAADAQAYLDEVLRALFPKETHEVQFSANGDAWEKVTWKEGD